MEQQLQELKDRIIAATMNKTPLRIRGNGSKDWYGQMLRGELLDTRGYTGIIDYEPTELVITARSGTPLSMIEKQLDEQRQMLAFEPPCFGKEATIGGVVASGLSGPRRASVGAVRDFVLGVTLMDGKGDLLHFGGQVMKNVAGYDVSRLLAGSLGTLGLITQVSLKVLPKPVCETTLRFDLHEADAIRRLNEWGGQPLPISASAWHKGLLIVRLSGAQAAVKAARQKMGGEEIGDGEAFWSGLREQRNPYFQANSASTALWRLSVPSHVPPLGLDGDTMIEWGGAQRWLKTEASADASAIRVVAERAGGHATLFRGGDKNVGVFHPLASAVAAIHHNLKSAFDPSGIFNPGRMYADF